MMTFKSVSILVGKIVGYSFEWLFAGICFYILFFLILSPISFPAEKTSEKLTETIYISTNGIHSDIILPIHHPIMDWEKQLSIHQELKIDTFQTHLKFGWGDKQFFMRTKEWSDMEVSVVLKTIFGRGAGAMHLILCTPKDLDPSSYRKLKLSKNQYQRLCSFIAYSFSYKNKIAAIIQNHQYSSFDLFFDSKLEYNMFYTCNTWTNNALYHAGQKACLWTPFKGPIFSKYE